MGKALKHSGINGDKSVNAWCYTLKLRTPPVVLIDIDDSPVAQANFAKYLGVILDPFILESFRITFSKQVASIRTQIRAAASPLQVENP